MSLDNKSNYMLFINLKKDIKRWYVYKFRKYMYLITMKVIKGTSKLHREKKRKAIIIEI